MKDEIAEVLLAKVMGWNESDIAAERPFIQAIANYKYNEYQQFSPGKRFIESLASWLVQFETLAERRTAYEFIKKRLIFISRAEMQHLVGVAYPDVIRPVILQKASRDLNMADYRVSEIARSTPFHVLLRQSLFLGLSDGAHVDVFRRSNSGAIGYEQVYQTYELSPERAEKMKGELVKELSPLLGREPGSDEARFKLLFLLDDFSGSGYTYLRRDDKGEFGGKIAAIYRGLADPSSPLSKLVDKRDLHIYLVLYLCTEQAYSHLCEQLRQLWDGSRVPEVIPVHLFNRTSCLSEETDRDFFALCQKDDYYDAATLEDTHTGRGGATVKNGFGQCTLPLVLSHNTPNNSVALLWSYDYARFKGLFPRVPRHREAG